MLIHWIWYATLPKLTLRQKKEILEHFSTPEDVFYTDRFDHIANLSPQAAEALENKDLSLARSVIKRCAEKQISILTMADAAYPARLRNISDPPLVLYYKGALPDFEGQPVISVVGTRRATAYGMNNARNISRQIAACGGLVVSGGAGGIDTAALQGALETGRQTVAVLGCGVNVVYPKTNRFLFERISQSGCILSEYLPDAEPKPWQFPERNRIISGLANGVLVVEAPEKSGALITARDAFDQGRDVFAVPGNIGVETCVGSNALLQEYAAPVFSGWDVMKHYADLYPEVEEVRETVPGNFAPPRVAQTRDFPVNNIPDQKKSVDNLPKNAYIDQDNNLSQQEQAVLACLSSQPKSVDAVIAEAQLPAATVLRILTSLALKGVVNNHPGRLVSANNR